MTDAAPPSPEERLASCLVAVGSARDRAAFAVLFAHFAPRLKAFHMRAGIPNHEAEDLAQDTMLMVWRKAGQYDPVRAPAATWIFTVARNLRVDRQRRPVPLPPEMPRDDSVAPELEFLAAERDGHLRRALEALPLEQREAVQAAYFADLTHAEAHRQLGIPLGTLKGRLRLALSRLRTVLKEAAE